MPTYKITNPTTGKMLSINGDTMPTESELDDIFAKTGGVKKKKGGWLPATGAAVGGLIGTCLGPGPGTAAGGFAGYGGGKVLQEMLYGKANENPDDYTGNTKAGFRELSDQGRINSGYNVLNAVKDASIAGATSYVGGGTFGPAGTGILPTLGRIAAKTAVGTGVGTLSGFGAGDLQTTTLEDRKQNAKTGAVIGGVTSLALGTGQEAFKAVTSSDIVKQLREGKGLDKFNVGNAGKEIANKGTYGHTFDRTQYYKDWFTEASKTSDVNKRKVMTEIEKTLSSEVGIKIKGVNSATPEQFAELMDNVSKLDEFKKTIPALDALFKRRDNVSTLSKNFIGTVEQTSTNQSKLIQNVAFNEQLKKISGVERGDQIIKTYHNIIRIATIIGLPKLVKIGLNLIP